MSHNPMHPKQAEEVAAMIAKQNQPSEANLGEGRVLTINTSASAGRINFKVDPDENAVYREWPKEFFVLQSVDVLTYDQVLDAFTDEPTFCGLQAVNSITGSRQRVVGLIQDPNDVVKEQMTAIQISLDGIISADVMLALHQNAQAAGHLLLPKRQEGMEGNTYTVLTVIPGYEALVAHG
jgi:hypothetical protein